jgi:hypothetical protein
MKADRRSGAARAGGAQALGRRPGRERLATVRADFFLDPTERLNERERAVMSAMLNGLVVELADRIRGALPGRLKASQNEHDLAADLNRAGLLDEPELIALLLRRAEEDRIAAAAGARAGRNEARVLQGLVGHENGQVSAAAMALILARSRRRDRFGQCLLAFDDLPGGTAATLVHRVAAAVKAEGGQPDRAITASSEALISAYDSAKSVEVLADSLAAALVEAEVLDDALLLASAHEGDVALLAHLLAHLAGISGAIAEGELLSGDPAAIIMLFRMAKLSRRVAAGILAAIGDLLGIDDPAAALATFAALKDPQIEEAHVLLTSDPAYRTALAMLEAHRG